jgi:hypothetical protein
MKKKTILLLFVLGLVGIIFPKQPPSISVQGNFLLTSDQGIKDTYGNGIIYPEIRYNSGSLGYDEFYIWAGMGYISLKSDNSNAAAMDQLTQYHFSLGCGYMKQLSTYWGINLRIGGIGVMFKDEVLNMDKTKLALGAIAAAALVFDWSNRFYNELEVGYSFITGKTDEGTSVKPGGLKVAIGIGIKF